MDDNDASVTELVLMGSLHINEGLGEECAERHGLVEADKAVVGTDFLERAEEGRLETGWSDG
jgi:hypothetical protein